MAGPEFRFCYATPRYEETVAFYRDVLGFEVFNAWEREGADRGTIFRSPNGAGLIEVQPGAAAPVVRGGLYIEVEDLAAVDAWARKLQRAGAPIHEPLGDTHYRHRHVKTVDPNGVEVGFFRYLPGGEP